MFVTSGLAQIAYDVTGAADHGHDVLMLHAGVNDRRSWQPAVAALGDRHRCIRFDQRGFGETTYEREDGWSRVDDALAVLDAVGVDEAVLLACSLGGGVAVDLALAHPDRVSGLVLIGSAVRGAPYPELTEPVAVELMGKADAAEEAEDWDTLNELEARLWLDGPVAPEGRVRGATRELFLEMNARALRAADPGDQKVIEDAWPRLERIAVPTLVMLGRLDLEDINWVGQQLAARVPGARLVWLEGVGHVPHLEGDPATLTEIGGFLDSLPARS